MKSINNIIRVATAGAALAVVFTIAFVAAPAPAHACWDGQCYQPYYYQDRNTYYQPQPIVYQQPVYQQPVYQQPVYQQPVYQYQYQQQSYPLTVSCYPNSTSVQSGQSVTWYANASGGSGNYSYTWNGTTGTVTSGSTGYSTYYTAGSYTVSVTVYSNGQSVTQSCGYVNVTGGSYGYNYNYTPNYAYNYPTVYTQTNYVGSNIGGNLVAACFADRTAASIGTPVTWAVEVTGGTGQYTYSWSGTDSLSGSNASVQKSYETTGSKNAAVLITSGGQTISQACGDSVSIRSGYVAPTNSTTNTTVTSNTTTNGNGLSAAALLGLGNIPWGWIAILIILVLVIAVFYLLFNRHKNA